jgi:hypothetical protein
MSRRLTLVMPFVLAASVVAISLSATTGDAADECLSGPKGVAPKGSHWYYRVDRSNGRHCWYLGAEGQRVRSVSERTSQQTRKRVAQHSQQAEKNSQPAPTSAPEPAARSSAAPPAVAETKTVASFFSQYWASLFSGAEPPRSAPAEEPKIALAADASRPAPSPVTSNYAQEQGQTDAQEEMPLVWPVLTEAETAATTAPASASAPKSAPETASALKSQHMLAILAGALAVAGILMALVYRLGTIRFGRRQQQRQSPRWDITTDTTAHLPMSAPLPLTYADPAPRPKVPVRKPVLPRRPPELDREGREPGEARRLRELRELREGLESKLEELRDAHRRSAA